MALDYEILRDYIHRMFLARSAFREHMVLRYNITLPQFKSYTYTKLLQNIAAQYGEERLLEMLNISNEEEALQKIEFIPLLVLVDKLNLLDIAEKIKIKSNYRMNRGDLTRTILVNNNISTFVSNVK